MAIIDVLKHSDKTAGKRDWSRVDHRRRTRTWRQQCKLWVSRTMRSSEFAEANPEPTRRQIRNTGLKNGRSIQWWIQSVVRKEGVVEMASLCKQVRGHLDSGRWGWMRGAFDRAVEQAIDRGMVIRVGSMLVSPRFASKVMQAKP